MSSDDESNNENHSSNGYVRNILQCFPFPEMRPKQKDVLERVAKAIDEGKRNIIIEAPTGFGKSPVAVAIAKYLGSSHACTGTKDLQAQYARDFKWLKVAKGRSNFECHELFRIIKNAGPDQQFHCGVAPCKLDSNYKCDYKTKLKEYSVVAANSPEEQVIWTNPFFKMDKPCDYYHQKYIAFTASHSVYNYHFFLDHALGGQGVAPRKAIIFDEAHMLEDVLTEYQGYTLSRNKIAKFSSDPDRVKIPDIGYDVDKWLDFLNTTISEIKDFLREAEENPGKSRRFTPENITAAEEELQKMERVALGLTTNRVNWVLTNIKYVKKEYSSFGSAADKEKNVDSIQFKPLDISGIAQALYQSGEIRIFMSATILGKDEFCKTLGLRAEETEFIQADSDFPVENRPIYKMDVGQLNARTFDEEMPKFAKAIDRIMSKHRNEKGIIHTSSYRQAEFIKKALSPENRRRLMETGEGVVRERLLEEHAQTSRPTVLLSPSLHTGVDLKDDLCRFQIIVKVPYPDLTDRLIEARKNRNPNWYQWKTALQVVQAYGRAIRHKDDFATTYVLDSNFSGYFMWTNKRLLPGWFQQAVRKPSANQITEILG